jgi:hypothetical protein
MLAHLKFTHGLSAFVGARLVGRFDFGESIAQQVALLQGRKSSIFNGKNRFMLALDAAD